MYERNAIVIDRFFANKFGYNEKNNLKNNYSNYCDLVSIFEDFQEVSDKEDKIILDVEKVANQIKETQKDQETYYRKKMRFEETRKKLFETLDEDAEDLKRKFSRIEEEVQKNDEDIRTNVNKFVDEIEEFNNKSITRNQYGKERRIVESEYRKTLNTTTENFNSINREKINEIREFLKQESKENEKKEIRAQIQKNGLKEKIPFDDEVITKAIDVSTEFEEKRLEVLYSTFEKTGRILNELNTENVKTDKHIKFIKDAKAKILLLNTISEYVVLFLDNERMNVVGGSKEHSKLMNEACENFDNDIIQIKNLYELLLKEISGKVSKKSYSELYNPKYLEELLNEQNKFEKNISKLNVAGTIIFPSYWRVEGVKKIFDTFKSIVTEEYGRDLSEYDPEPINQKEEIYNENEFNKDYFDWGDDDEDNEFEEDDEWEDDENDFDEENDMDLDDNEADMEEDNQDYGDYEDDEDNEEEDRTIDEILGFYDSHSSQKSFNTSKNNSNRENEEDIEDMDFEWDDDEESLDFEDETEEDDEKPKKGLFKKKNK